MRRQNPDSFAVLCNVQLPFHYIGDGYHLSNRTHVFTLNERGRVAQFRYNNCDRAPLDAATLAPIAQLGAPHVDGAITYDRVYNALQLLHHMLDDASMKVQFKLAPGKVTFPSFASLTRPVSTAASLGHHHQQQARATRALGVFGQPPPLRCVRAAGRVDGSGQVPHEERLRFLNKCMIASFARQKWYCMFSVLCQR
jgi:hypothetical protein